MLGETQDRVIKRCAIYTRKSTDDRLAQELNSLKHQRGFFARVVRLNYLAPDIVAAILDGRHPPGLTRKALVNANLPMDWALQRRLLGFRDPAQPDIIV